MGQSFVFSAVLRTWGGALLLSLTIVACGTLDAGSLEIRLHAPDDESKAVIEVVNVPRDVIARLTATELTRERWTDVLRVSTGLGQPAMVGAYVVSGTTVRFTPMFALDRGRDYFVTFHADGVALSRTVSFPAVITTPSTVVSSVFPSGGSVPQNQLRLYIHFSAPMGRKGGLDFVRLLDDTGAEVIDPFLPLDAEFWNDDHTRYTVFFDPGRQKRGILPNQQMGRSLESGRRYTLIVKSDWRDANGLPLKHEFRREFRVRAADEKPIDPKLWRIEPPIAGKRNPLVVTFPESLDYGLLQRAVGVTAAEGKFLAGDIRIDGDETRWSFTPREAWRPGEYHLVALAILEDVAGNRIGRAFEVDQFSRSDSPNDPDRTRIPFVVDH